MPTLVKPEFRFVDEKGEHAYFLRDKPMIGTTTALSVLAKELTWWAAEMACGEFGWLNPKKNPSEACLEAARVALERIRAMSLGEYASLLSQAYRAHSAKKNKAATKGKDMHALLEEFIKAEMTGTSIMFPEPQIQPFIAWSRKNVKRFLFTEMCCYSETLWCAGTADFGYEDMEGNYVLGDFKSSEAAYFNMWVQVGGYDLQISENGGYTTHGQKVFSLTRPFNYYAIFAERAGLDKPFISRDMVRLKKAFAYAVNLYREKMFFEEGK